MKWYIENSEAKQIDALREDQVRAGESIYEVIRIIDGVPLFLESHLKRFINSSKLINKPMLLSVDEINLNIKRLLALNDVLAGNVKIVFNYSKEFKTYVHDENTSGYKSCTSLFYLVKHSYPTKEQYASGVDTIFFHRERNNPNAKVLNESLKAEVELCLNNSNVYEAILIDKNNNITEGSKSNIFMIKGDTVFTSRIESVLPGVTRGSIIDILTQNNIKFEEKDVSFKDIELMDALFITGTSPKVLPIRTVDGYVFQSSSNPLLLKIMQKYDEKIEKYIMK